MVWQNENRLTNRSISIDKKIFQCFRVRTKSNRSDSYSTTTTSMSSFVSSRKRARCTVWNCTSLLRSRRKGWQVCHVTFGQWGHTSRSDVNRNNIQLSALTGTIFDFTKLLEFADLGVYCQFDLFGTECSHYQLNPTAFMPSDYQRIENIIKLSKEGFTNRLLMSHDIHTKHRLVSVNDVAMNQKEKLRFSVFVA